MLVHAHRENNYRQYNYKLLFELPTPATVSKYDTAQSTERRLDKHELST